MPLQQLASGKTVGNMGNKPANPRQPWAAADSGRGTSGEHWGTTGNRNSSFNPVCSPCSPAFSKWGTAGGRVFPGCSPCSPCSPRKDSTPAAGKPGAKPLQPAPRLACSLFSGARKWRAAVSEIAAEISLQAAPFLGCSGFARVSAQIRHFAQCAGRIAASRASRGLQRFLPCVSWVRLCAGSGASAPCQTA